jgi:hypothetical protein
VFRDGEYPRTVEVGDRVGGSNFEYNSSATSVRHGVGGGAGLPGTTPLQKKIKKNGPNLGFNKTN